MYWHKKRDRPAGGLWRCRVRKREVDAADRARNLEKRRASQLARWHQPGGGYVKSRRRLLAARRAQILEQLDQLAQEALSAES